MAGKAIQLERLVKALGREDLATVEALLIDAARDREAAAMLHYLLEHGPGQADGAGWVAVSHLEWWAALRIKQNRLGRLNGLLEACGVEIILKKRKGAPVKHYRVNAEKLAAVLAERLGLPVGRVLELAGADSDMYQNREIHVVVSFIQNLYQRTLEVIRTTTDHFAKIREKAIRQVEERAVQLALALPAMPEKTARRLVARYGPKRVRAVAGYAAQAANLNNPAGFVVAKLRDGWEPPVKAAKQTVTCVTANGQEFEVPASMFDSSRYVTGKFAEFVVH